MDIETNDFDDFIDFFGGVERDVRPKKVKAFKNYIKAILKGLNT
jgi:hypothetical protein